MSSTGGSGVQSTDHACVWPEVPTSCRRSHTLSVGQWHALNEKNGVEWTGAGFYATVLGRIGELFQRVMEYALDSGAPDKGERATQLMLPSCRVALYKHECFSQHACCEVWQPTTGFVIMLSVADKTQSSEWTAASGEGETAKRRTFQDSSWVDVRLAALTSPISQADRDMAGPSRNRRGLCYVQPYDPLLCTVHRPTSVQRKRRLFLVSTAHPSTRRAGSGMGCGLLSRLRLCQCLEADQTRQTRAD